MITITSIHLTDTRKEKEKTLISNPITSIALILTHVQKQNLIKQTALIS